MQVYTDSLDMSVTAKGGVTSATAAVAVSAGQAADVTDVEIQRVIDAEEEAQEEVAEAVQQARREQLRDDVLSMVCPTDWTIQAEEPPGQALLVPSAATAIVS